MVGIRVPNTNCTHISSNNFLFLAIRFSHGQYSATRASRAISGPFISQVFGAAFGHDRSRALVETRSFQAIIERHALPTSSICVVLLRNVLWLRRKRCTLKTPWYPVRPITPLNVSHDYCCRKLEMLNCKLGVLDESW
jgi:hypothetical protein